MSEFVGLKVAYTEKFLDVRAHLAVELLRERWRKGAVDWLGSWADASELELGKWRRARAAGEELDEPELFGFGAGVVLVERLLDDRILRGGYGVYFHPAAEQKGCAIWSAQRMVEAGLRVGFLGLGGERAEGLPDEVRKVWVEAEGGDDELVVGVREGLAYLREGEPDVLVLSVGEVVGIGLEGWGAAAHLVAGMCAESKTSVLVLGSGGGVEVADVWDVVVAGVCAGLELG